TWREKEMTYLTNVPNDYIQISSGLGEALPSCVVILPLKLNEEVFGIIELALFKQLESHEIEFLQRVCDTIAAALSTAKVNTRTQRLLVQTRHQTMELQNQEEEMRQNVEELSATQEELVRKETEYVKRIKELEHRLSLNDIAA
ncbi:MAG: GAF domain-containing protein, partial [Bacteroidia bacterium]|nr:GAF domain-containing protein [Bacteroidia bacterium]